MNTDGHIYQATKDKPVEDEDVARLDGYLRARAEADAKLIAEKEIRTKKREIHRALKGITGA